MIYEKIDLAGKYDYLKKNNSVAKLVCMVPHFIPEMNRQDEKRPCILVCPGGGYAFCSEREAEPIAMNFLKLGFNAYVLYYSLAPDYHYPLQLNEVAAAFDTIKKLAQEHHSDIEKIGIIGFSAGGHLAAHYSTAFDSQEVRENFKESIRPFATMLGYPVITADKKVAHIGSIENLVGKYPEEKDADKYSCEKLVNENTPQCFIWHTAEDSCVPVENSLMYALALSKYKIPYELHIYPKGDHGLSTSDIVTLHTETPDTDHAHNWLYELERWIKLTF
mgnify:CR=1 FL=1